VDYQIIPEPMNREIFLKKPREGLDWLAKKTGHLFHRHRLTLSIDIMLNIFRAVTQD
jgi:hypothetical protein